MATTILLARHGETDWNRERRVQGHTDRPLNEVGRAQARALADRLAAEPIEAVYSSDLARARETAHIVAEPRGLTVVAVPELREKNFGTWEGLTDEEIVARFPEAAGGQWGDGETSEQVAARILRALRGIAAAHPAGHVLVVSHGGALRAVLRHSGTCCSDGIANCHVSRIAVEGRTFRSVD